MSARDLTSPAGALVHRLAVEEELATTIEHELGLFLAVAADMAYHAIDFPVLLAAGNPFTLGPVLGAWGAFVDKVKIAVAAFLPAKNMLDPFVAAAASRLQASELPVAVYDSVKTVMATALAQRWSVEETRRELELALRPSTPSVTSTAEGLRQQGPSWEVMASRIARTEATTVAGHTTLLMLADAGYTRKGWVAHHDKLTRPAHRQADGQTLPLTSLFIVGGYGMMSPGDPAAPYELTANCRCTLIGVP